MSRFSRILVLVSATLAATACNTVDKVFPDTRVEYKNSQRAERLEVPPDLTTSTIDDALVVPELSPTSSATFSDYDQERSQSGVVKSPQVLAEPANVRVQRDGDRRWLVAKGDVVSLWARTRQFWLSNGFVIEKDEARIGIMETGWSENRANIPQDPVRRVIGKVLDPLYSSGTRDKFRIRMERGVEEGTTEIFLTHRGMEEVLQGTPDEDEGTRWRSRPSDPELENEMLKRLMVYLGADETRATRQLARAPEEKAVAARLVGKGRDMHLLLTDDFPRAWRNVGVALDRSGFLVEDRDRSKGTFFVRYSNAEAAARKEGFFSKLAFWDDDSDEEREQQYLVNLGETESGTRVTVATADGTPDDSGTAQKVLKLLFDQLK